MGIWHICGGKPLSGSVRVQGAKNAVLPILAATVVTGCETELLNCPALSDVDASLDILRCLGCRAERVADSVYIDSRPIDDSAVPDALMTRTRSSVIFLGALLARFGEASLSAPGGCELGPRPIDLHLAALRQMGAEIREKGGELRCTAARLRGARINLDFPSVGATENIMLAACGAEGETVITNAAKEPEIRDLQDFLNALGARVSGAGTHTVVINGFAPRRSVGHRVMPDRIAAATLLCATASAGGAVELTGADPRHFESVLASLEDMGCVALRGRESLCFMAPSELRACRPVITKPYPGFPTDAQPLIMAAALKARGTTVIVENIFENRFRHAQEMRLLGADIRTEGRVAIVSGVAELHGATLRASDLRGAAALVASALGASGESAVHDAGFSVRGYAALPHELRLLGAQIEYKD